MQGTIGSAFIVGSGLSHSDIARQLTAFALTFPAGQLLGAVLVAIAEAAGMPTTAVFLAATVVLLALTVASWPFLRVPADRLAAAVRAAPPAQAGSTDSAGPKTGVGRLLRSLFGLFLLAVVLSSIGNNGLTSQLANVMPHVYGFTDTATSLLLGAAGLINIPVILVTGKWLTHTRTINVYAAGTALRAVGALAMALIGLMTTPVLVLAAIAMLITYQGVPVPRVAAADLAVQLSPTGPVQADGYYFAASASGPSSAASWPGCSPSPKASTPSTGLQRSPVSPQQLACGRYFAAAQPPHNSPPADKTPERLTGAPGP